MRTLFSVVICGVAWAVVVLAQVQPDSKSPVVDLGYAKYFGTRSERFGVNTWFGIRYAIPPTGELRWQAPQDIESKNSYSSSQIINATIEGPQCYQGEPAWSHGAEATSPTGSSEDCLLLDVTTPMKPSSERLPVVVLIHGGGYVQGNSEDNPGYALVNQSNGGLVYVTIQYRLGALGFLSSSAVRADGVANAGLLDQRAALGWVQRHIGAFGGDPHKVTIWGGSAGGGSVVSQLMLYGGEINPPFRSAIAEYPWMQPYHPDSVLEDQYHELLNATSCDSLFCLRALSTSELVTATQATYGQGYWAIPEGHYGYGDFYYGPAVDGNIIRELPSQAFKQGHFSKVPFLTDHDGYEGVVFTNKSEKTVAEEIADLHKLFPYAKQSFFNELFKLYPRDDFNSTFYQRQQIFGDFIIDCPTYAIASAYADRGLPTWKMIFDAGTQLHGATGTFLFAPPGTPEAVGVNETLGYIMRDYFLSFVINLDPNTESLSNTSKPFWPMYQAPSSSRFSVMDVNVTNLGVREDFDAAPKCDFFAGQSYAVRN